MGRRARRQGLSVRSHNIVRYTLTSRVDSHIAIAFNHTEVVGHPFYQIWYVGWDENYESWNLGYAISENGTDWTPHADNPSWPDRRASSWDAGKLQSHSIAWDKNIGGYTMLYGGISEDQSFFGIGLAASYNGMDWQLSDQFHPSFSLYCAICLGPKSLDH